VKYTLGEVTLTKIIMGLKSWKIICHTRVEHKNKSTETQTHSVHVDKIWLDFFSLWACADG